ncbi:zf-HC2 domain-containing protein [Salicola sp. Rm-C-2C1-2]|uniref:anti-sigma factor family protein n=1 Tax=Salicola sp. Rm-C-2C1-2 TaxID=3141321 RepID=UPI0032E43E17
MVKCRDITLVASDYVDGRLRWSKRLAVVAHLIMCPHCRRFMANFRAVVTVIRGHCPPQSDTRQIETFKRTVDGALEKPDAHDLNDD